MIKKIIMFVRYTILVFNIDRIYNNLYFFKVGRESKCVLLSVALYKKQAKQNNVREF